MNRTGTKLPGGLTPFAWFAGGNDPAGGVHSAKFDPCSPPFLDFRREPPAPSDIDLVFAD